MKKLIFIFLVFSTTSIFAQQSINVPVGSIKSFWIDSPTANSSYEWGIENGGGAIISGQNTDKIFVEFDSTEGTSTVWVREINAGGCEGEKSYINIVRFKGANATIAISGEYPLCYENNGSEITVTFTGTPPFTLKYTENGTEKEITTSDIEYKIPVPQLTETTVYELISVSDTFGVENPLTATVTIEVYPQLHPLKIIHD